MKKSTFIFVSHNIVEMKSLFSCFYLLNNGVIKKDESNEMVEDYINDAYEKGDSDLALHKRFFPNGNISENDFFELKQVYTNSLEEGYISESSPIEFCVELLTKKYCRIDMSFGVEGLLGNELFYVTTLLNETIVVDDNITPNNLIFKTKIPAYTLKKGKYILTLTLIVNNKTIISRFRTCYFQINSKQATSNSIIGQRPNVALIFGDWSFKSKQSES